MINPPTVLLHKCKGNKFQRNAGLLFIVGEVSAKFLPKFRNTMVLIFALLYETLESKELRTNYGLQSKCVLTSGRNFVRCYFGIFARPRNKVFQAVLHTTARGKEILKWDLPAKHDRKFSGRERHCYLPRVTFWWAREQVILLYILCSYHRMSHQTLQLDCHLLQESYPVIQIVRFSMKDN